MSAISPESMLDRETLPLPYLLVRHIVDFLQWQFSMLEAGAYRYSSEEDSEICITAETPIDPVKVGMRPAIAVTRGHAGYQGMTIGDRAFIDLRSGAQVYMDLIPTTIAIYALSSLPAEAERLAYFCVRRIQAYRDAIVKEMPELHSFGQRASIAPPTPAGAIVGESTDFEWTQCMISFPATLQEMLTTVPLNKRILSGFSIRANTTQPELAPAPRPVLLQGTAVSQPRVTPEAALDPNARLPQEGGNAAESSEPLVLKVKT